MKKISFVTIFTLLWMIVVQPKEVVAQRKRTPAPPPAASPAPPLTCTPAQTAATERKTYLVGAAPMSSEELTRIEEKWGTLTIPVGETERARQVRIACAAYKQQQIATIEESFAIWTKLHPRATAKQAKLRRAQQDQAIENIQDYKRIQARMKLRQWDWRSIIDVGPVLNQGKGCNTCWAVTAATAAACSIRKNYADLINRPSLNVDPKTGEMIALTGGVSLMAGDPEPFVQDLLNCMPLKKDEMCNSGWHGNAFDFMVFKKGVPLAYQDGYSEPDKRSGKMITYKREYTPGEKLTCNPSAGFLKADDWDYVNSPPDKLPTVEQLKSALAEHGPIVAPIFYDECLANYRSGVFNEKDAGMVNHVVLLIGWDDTKQAWLVKNSWGEGWGDKGFGWIKYGSNNIGVFAAFVDARR